LLFQYAFSVFQLVSAGDADVDIVVVALVLVSAAKDWPGIDTDIINAPTTPNDNILLDLFI
jgi:hypothetical protein